MRLTKAVTVEFVSFLFFIGFFKILFWNHALEEYQPIFTHATYVYAGIRAFCWVIHGFIELRRFPFVLCFAILASAAAIAYSYSLKQRRFIYDGLEDQIGEFGALTLAKAFYIIRRIMMQFIYVFGIILTVNLVYMAFIKFIWRPLRRLTKRSATIKSTECVE
eukprot:TRINITY_DN23119_c0_g1_i1.p1 TRINITY_DN23119_c0_g1~~TRINITY_DN23119_c0_g1_i1.p1  ORF type:complete len:179 (-),score=3.71 TRINITY_DN23119_c0_g1_i1:213-701(-)